MLIVAKQRVYQRYVFKHTKIKGFDRARQFGVSPRSEVDHLTALIDVINAKPEYFYKQTQKYNNNKS